MNVAWLWPVPDPGAPDSLQGGVMNLVQTILGEAEGESPTGKLAVAWVIEHRRLDDRWPWNYSDVCLQPKQFSCWNAGSQRLRVMRTPMAYTTEEAWSDCWRAAIKVMFKMVLSPVGTSCHYAAEASPRWAHERVADYIIGRHYFWEGIA